MNRTAILGSLLAGATGCVDGDALSTTRSPIIGGQLATAGEFPTVLALETGPGNWFCTGTLIDKKWALTAAHCVEGAPMGAVKVRLDDLDVNNTTGGLQVQVSQIHSHPGFGGAQWGMDMALLELATPVDRPVTPIHRMTIPFNTAVTQVGYGVTDDNGNGGGILRKLSERNQDCALTGEASADNAKVLCFNPMDGGGCYGDSGGPTFVQVDDHLEVVGVTSGGTGQMCTDSWGIWSLVPAELQWLDSIMMAAPPPPPPPPPPPVDPTLSGEITHAELVDGEVGGCSSSGGGSSALFAVSLAGLALRRRRRR
jgi:uncharacterized protein (TIGR03382 family)